MTEDTHPGLGSEYSWVRVPDEDLSLETRLRPVSFGLSTHPSFCDVGLLPVV